MNAYGQDQMSLETRETLHSQFQEGLRYSLMKVPPVSGAQKYKELCMAAKKEEKRQDELKKRQEYTTATLIQPMLLDRQRDSRPRVRVTVSPSQDSSSDNCKIQVVATSVDGRVIAPETARLEGQRAQERWKCSPEQGPRKSRPLLLTSPGLCPKTSSSHQSESLKKFVPENVGELLAAMITRLSCKVLKDITVKGRFKDIYTM